MKDLKLTDFNNINHCINSTLLELEGNLNMLPEENISPEMEYNRKTLQEKIDSIKATQSVLKENAKQFLN